MNNDKIALTMQDILEKEFKIDARGYRAQEVDKFLDMVMSDYTEFMNIIKHLEKENRILTSDYNKLKNDYRKLRDTIDSASESSSGITNVDLLKRVSNLEKAIFGKDN